MSESKTLYQIILDVLSEHIDSNLASDIAKAVIADEICKTYFNETDIPDDAPFDEIYNDEISNLDVNDDNFIHFGD